MKTYQPYTYLIRFKPTGQHYYGVRWAKNCHPNEFWKKYLTTSKVVKRLIAEHGTDSFEVTYTKNHATKEAALKWEELFLVSVNAAKSDLWLNNANGGKNFCVTAESLLKGGESIRKKFAANPEIIKNAIKARKAQLALDPTNGVELIVRNLNKFCRDYLEETGVQLYTGALILVAKGGQTNHKGVKCYYYNEIIS